MALLSPQPLPPFPDVEVVLLELLAPVATPVTGLPVEVVPPMVQVERIGGRDDGITDRPLVRTIYYATTRQGAWAMARTAQQLLAWSAGRMVAGPLLAVEYPAGVLIDAVATTTPPRQIAELGRDRRLVEAVHEVHLRRPWW